MASFAQGPARVNRGLIKKSYRTKGFMDSVLNGINTNRLNTREDKRNKELDAIEREKIAIRQAEIDASNLQTAATKAKNLQEFEAAKKTASGFIDSGLQYADDNGELQTYYIPTLRPQLGAGKYTAYDTMRESRKQLGYLLQQIQNPDYGKNILRAIKESPQGWEDHVINLLDQAGSPYTDEDGNIEYMGILMNDFQGQNEKDRFQPLFDAYTSLDAKEGMSLQAYAQQINDNAFPNFDKINTKLNKSNLNARLFKHKENPEIMSFMLYNPNNKENSIDLSDSDFQEIKRGDGNFAKQPPVISRTLAQKVSLMEANGTLNNIDENVLKTADFMLNNRQLLGIEAVLANAAGSSSTSDAVKKLVNNLQLTTVSVNPEESLGKGIPSLTLRENNAKALALAVITENHMGKQYSSTKTPNGVKLTKLKPTDAIDPKDKLIGYNILAKNKATDSIANIQTLLSIQKQLMEDYGEIGQASNLGSKAGFITDFTQVTKTTFSNVAKIVKSFVGEGTNESMYTMENYVDLWAADEKQKDSDFDLNFENRAKLKEAQDIYVYNMSELIEKQNATTDKKAKEAYALRMRAEGLKVRMAFNIASLVQGGGTGGGRTISNADFAFIYDSLFGKLGTADAFNASMAQVRHEMLKQKVASDTFLNFKEYGTNAVDTANTLAGAYLDAQIASNFNITKYAPENFKDSLPNIALRNKQLSEVAGVFVKSINIDKSGKVTTAPPKIEELMKKEGFKILTKEQVGVLQQNINDISQREFTDESINTLAGNFAVTLGKVLVLDNITQKNKVDRNRLAQDLTDFDFSPLMIDKIVNQYENIFGKDAYKHDEDSKTIQTTPPDFEEIVRQQPQTFLPNLEDFTFTVSVTSPMGGVQQLEQTISLNKKISPFLFYSTFKSDPTYAKKMKELEIDNKLIQSIDSNFSSKEEYMNALKDFVDKKITSKQFNELKTLSDEDKQLKFYSLAKQITTK